MVLDVYPERFAWGLLVLPKDLKPGERRPVVVCQHGRDGLPRNLLDGNMSAYRIITASHDQILRWPQPAHASGK